MVGEESQGDLGLVLGSCAWSDPLTVNPAQTPTPLPSYLSREPPPLPPSTIHQRTKYYNPTHQHKYSNAKIMPDAPLGSHWFSSFLVKTCRGQLFRSSGSEGGVPRSGFLEGGVVCGWRPPDLRTYVGERPARIYITHRTARPTYGLPSSGAASLT